MATIIKKAYSEYFQAIWEGKKNYDLRLADWDCKEGDILILKEINKKREYTGRELKKKITYVGKFSLQKLYDYWSKEEIEKYGLQVISLKTERILV